ncbi:hypothetical protein BT69DRAFT_1330044 [Atractiella rhizophila]|nr:hypothetical protein BT69DRAFT_1330044 [Atractiella rhizophila]
MDAFSDEKKARIVRIQESGGGRRLRTLCAACVGRIKRLDVWDVEDSASSASSTLQLPHGLERLSLQKYPPLPSLNLPHTLRVFASLQSVSPPLPPSQNTLYRLFWKLSKSSLSPSPLMEALPSYTLRLTFHTSYTLAQMDLDGGEETSNLVPPKLFSTLKNVRSIHSMSLRYCVVVSPDFPEFIHWFFGDWQVRGVRMQVDGVPIGSHLEVHLFFGEWSEEEIISARRMIGVYTLRGRSGGVW